jgi:phosphonopyruvate decarboxylase
MSDIRTKDVIDSIFQSVTDEVVITSTGYISREAFRHDRPRNFYMQGSLGMALAIGLGIAYSRPDLKVLVISGDGACLMSLGTLALHKQLV